jgi:hypothetical protein
MVRRLCLALVVTLASPALGCATADGMQEKLYDATRGYNRALRWGDFDRAAAYLPDPSVDAFLSQTEEVEDKLVIIDYQLSRLKLEKQTGQAASRVEIKWHTDDRLIVEETIVDQTWQFYEGQWFLVDERRARGKPLAIFAETPTDENDEAVADSPHPYLPGLEGFRDTHEIGLSPQEKRVRDRDRRRARRGSDARSELPVASHSSPQAFEPSPGT